MSYILLVEDNQDNADLMLRLLQTEGYQVIHFINGLDGVRQARQEQPALILMDFNLPDVDGRTLALTLKKQLTRSDMKAPPIIAVTARTGVHEEAMAAHFGCDAFVRKPFDPEAFLAVVRRFFPRES